MHDRASRGPGRAVRAARQSTTRDLVVGRAGLDAAASSSQNPMRLPTASPKEQAASHLRWQRGPARWREWPWPAGGCAWAGFRHTQIDQLTGCRLPPGPCAGGGLRAASFRPAWRARGPVFRHIPLIWPVGGVKSVAFSPKSLKWRLRSLQLAHFVWEKCRARTTYIVKGCPRETFRTR